MYYTGDKSSCERKVFPVDLPPTPPQEWGQDRYEPCSVEFIPEINLDYDDQDLQYPPGKTWEDFYNLVYATSYTRPSPPFSRDVNRFLGFPHDVPRDMQFECELIALTGSPYYDSASQ